MSDNKEQQDIIANWFDKMSYQMTIKSYNLYDLNSTSQNVRMSHENGMTIINLAEK